MTLESNAWAAVRRALAPYGRLVRVENRVEAGTPDVAYCLLGVSGWLELKSGAGLEAEQLLWAEEWSRAGGLWHLLRRGRRGGAGTPLGWALYDVGAARRLYEGLTIGNGWAWMDRLEPATLLEALAPRALRRSTSAA